MAKLNRPSAVLYCQSLALALTIASSGCHDDRTLGEIVETTPRGLLCGGAPCDGWCERPARGCDAPTVRGICRASLSAEARNTRLVTCVRNGPLEPVCGCDGRTYRNDCERTIYEQSQFKTGTCSGLTCTGAADCSADEFCEFSAGRCGFEGICQPGGPAATAVRCRQDPETVCGCDGNTYANECQRRQAGVSIRQLGPCPS